jgi:folylpolyglutamate synthase/dihydropteroate synthase
VSDPRGLPAQELARRLVLGGDDARLAESTEAGCEAARLLAVPGDRVVVCGGFYVVGSALRWLRIY